MDGDAHPVRFEPRQSFGLPRMLRANRLTYADDTLYAADDVTGSILRTNLATGVTDELPSGPPAVSSQLHVAGEFLYGLDGNGDVLRIDRTTGAREAIVCASDCGPAFATAPSSLRGEILDFESTPVFVVAHATTPVDVEASEGATTFGTP